MELSTPILIVDDEEGYEDTEGKDEESIGAENDDEATIIDHQVVSEGCHDDDDGVVNLRDCLEAWDDLGGLAIAVGSKLIKRESDRIREACHRIDKRSSKRTFEEMHHGARIDDAAERRSVLMKLERMQRMAQLLYNYELTHRRLRFFIEAMENREDRSW